VSFPYPNDKYNITFWIRGTKMDVTLSNIIRNAGFQFQAQYDSQDVNIDHVLYKFVPYGSPTISPDDRKKIAKIIRDGLDNAKFKYASAAFEKLEQEKGPDYWAFAIRVEIPFADRLNRATDRDLGGNLVFNRNTRNVFGRIVGR
jgi:hypothetical protein